jgi:hypothetical protein
MRIAFTRNEIPPHPCTGRGRRQPQRNFVEQQCFCLKSICCEMTHWRSANPVRLSLASELGGEIDGAWWPRVDRMTRELPGLIQVLTPLLGDITSINVNWPHLQRPPDFNWPGWERKPQHVITVNGEHARVNLLVVAYTTYSGLALMVLRRAAGLGVVPADRDKPAFITAGSILQAAVAQRAGQLVAQVPQNVR